MCGIGGIYLDRSDRNPTDLGTTVDKMLAAMVHRGPDQGGRWTGHADHVSIALGARRLAIQDLSEAGSQPMFDAATGNVIVFNGEVYNFRDLRNQLIARIGPLKTASDTEVVLRGYAVWGPGIVNRLRGMFAFALWDAERGALFLARDRLGVKPLYYHSSPGLFAFASEIRALLQGGIVSAILSPAAIRSYLAFGAVSEPATIIQGLRAFPPATSGYLTRSGLKLTRYWSLTEAFERDQPVATASELQEELESILTESVKLRMISDAPIGVFLSGGLDSTLVAALAASCTSTPIHSVSIVFEESDFSEKAWIDRTVAHIGSHHHEVKLADSDLLALVPGALSSYDQPTIDAINTYIVSKKAHDSGLTVALSGIGGDELFGGYPAFEDVRRLRLTRRTAPAPLIHATVALMRFLPSRRDRIKKLNEYFLDNGGDGIETELIHRELFVADDRRALTSLSRTSPVSDMARGHWIPPSLDDFNAVSYSELTGYLLNTLLRDTDFASMASSLEVREPYLDHEFIAATAPLPGAAKRGPENKWLLRQVARRVLPKTLLQPKKRGFTFPMDRWLRGALRGEIATTLLDPSFSRQLAELIPQDAIEHEWSSFLNGRTIWTRPWALYVLKAWAARWAA